MTFLTITEHLYISLAGSIDRKGKYNHKTSEDIKDTRKAFAMYL